MKSKFKDFMSDKWNKLVGAALAVGTFSTGAISAHAEDASEAVSAAQSVLDTASATLNIGNIVAIIGAGIGAVIVLFLGWWGARKLVKMLKSAFTKGKISL